MKRILIQFVLPVISTIAAAHDHTAIAVPPGHAPAIKLLGAGELEYQCKAAATTYEWLATGSSATLYDMEKAPAGRYYSGLIWESDDGSRIIGRQLATLPSSSPGTIPHQLVKIVRAAGKGMLSGVTFIQRVDTHGGAAPDAACSEGNVGEHRMVTFRAAYIFYKEV